MLYQFELLACTTKRDRRPAYLVSRWTVCRLQNRQYFFFSSLPVVRFLFLSVW